MELRRDIIGKARNRLQPSSCPGKGGKARAGGLEVAVNAALKKKTGIWFGWSGKVGSATTFSAHRATHDGIAYITLDLSKKDHRNITTALPIAFFGHPSLSNGPG